MFVLDEIDCLLDAGAAAARLDALDRAPGASFRDHCLDLPLDLSEALFVATATSLIGNGGHVPARVAAPGDPATRVSVRSCRYSGPTTGWSTREPAQRRKSADELKWAEPGSAHCGEERTGLAGRVGQSARIFSGRRRRVWLGQPHVHTGSTERLPTRRPG